MALIFFGLLLAVGLAEGVARFLGPPYEIGDEVHRMHQCDLAVGWRGLPNASTIIDWYDNRHVYQLNNQGMHDTDHPFQKEAGVFRILMLGDSMIEAIEVAEPETSHQVLEDTLNARAPAGLTFEVINMGIFAWGPPQPPIYFQEEGYRYQPDLVLAVWFPGNDLLDVIPNHVMTTGPTGGVHCFAPYFAVCDGQFDSQPWYAAPGIPPAWQECTTHRRLLTNSLNWIYYHSRLYQRLAALLLNVYAKETFTTHLYAPWTDFERQDDTLNWAYQVTVGAYSQLATEAAQQGAETALVIAPINQAVNFEVKPDWRAAIIATEPVLQNGSPTLANQTFTELMTAEGVPVLDLHPYFVAHMQQGGESIYWEENAVHWTVAGNRLAGETMAEWLIEQGLVPLE